MPFSSNPNAYKGLGVPLAGESRIQQESTKDVLTLEHSSANVGRFITFRDSFDSSLNGKPSTLATNDVAWFDADGGLVSAVGKQFGVETLSTASTAVTITSTQSGKLLVSNGMTSGVTITLPTAVAGLSYIILQGAGHTSVALTVLGSSDGDILFGGGGNTTLATSGVGIRANTTARGQLAELVAYAANSWLLIPAVNTLAGTSVTGEAAGGWIAVTS